MFLLDGRDEVDVLVPVCLLRFEVSYSSKVTANYLAELIATPVCKDQSPEHTGMAHVKGKTINVYMLTCILGDYRYQVASTLVGLCYSCRDYFTRETST